MREADHRHQAVGPVGNFEEAAEGHAAGEELDVSSHAASLCPDRIEWAP